MQRRLSEMSVLLAVLDRHRQVTGHDLEEEIERRLVIERAVTQIVDLAVKINTHVATATGRPAPADYHQSFAAAAGSGAITADLATTLAPSTGLRNRLIHEYDDIDLDVVADAIAEAVDGYRTFVTQVSRWLQADR